MADHTIRIGIDARGARTGGAAVRDELGKVKGAAKGLRQELVATGRAAVNTRNFLLAMSTAFGISQAVQLADTYRLIQARLLNVEHGTTAAARAYTQLLDQSNRTRSSLEGTVQLYTRLRQSGERFGITQQRALVITENVNRALRISGATAIEAASAQMQLAQAIASGTLQGDEFRAVMENAPRLARALVDALHLEGGIGQLRQLSKQGRLTVDQLVRALTDAHISQQLEQEFSRLPVTVSDSLGVLKNQLTDFIGKINEGWGVTSGLASIILLLANNLGTVAAVAFPLFVNWLVRASGLTRLLGSATGGLTGAIGGLGQRMAVASRHAQIYGAGMTAVTLAKRGVLGVGRTLMGLMGGPWGAVLTGAAVLWELLANRTDLAAEASQRMQDREASLIGVVNAATGAINTQNQALIANIRLKALADMQTGQSSFNEQSSGLIDRLRGTRPEVAAHAEAGGEGGNLGAQMFTRGQVPAEMSRVISSFFNSRGANADQTVRDIERVGRASGVTERDIRDLQTRVTGLATTWRDLNQSIATTHGLNRGSFTPEEMQLLGLAGPAQPPITSPPHSGSGRHHRERQGPDLDAQAQRTAERLADIRSRWDDQPKLEDQAANDLRMLDRMVGTWVEINGQRVKYTEAMRQSDADRISDGLTRQVRQDLAAQRDGLMVQQLILAGHTQEAEAVRRTLEYRRQGIPIDQARYEQILGMVKAEEMVSRELAKQQRATEIYMQAVSDVRGAFEKMLLDFRPDRFFKSVFQSFRQLQARMITERIFGPIQQEIEDMVTGRTGVRAANEELSTQVLSTASSVTTANDNLETFANALDQATNMIGQSVRRAQDIANGAVPSPLSISSHNPADNNQWWNVFGNSGDNNDVTVTGQRNPAARPRDYLGTSAADIFNRIGLRLATPIIRALDHLGIHLPEGIGDKLGSVLQSISFGATIGSGISQALGLSRGGAMSQLGGGIGGALGKVAGQALGKMVGGTLGSALGPIGEIAGSILGSILGSALQGHKTGKTTITGVDQSLTGAGNDAGMNRASVQAGGQIQDTIRSIADRLGGTLGSFAVSIGQRDGKWRVDPSGRGVTKTSKGAIDFGDDSEVAIKYAILNAIQDGAIQGLRAGTQKLLQNAKDLERGLDKALKFEQVFKDLKQMTDPVGYALDELNRQFKELRDIFTEAGASTEEWASLEQLYSKKREELLKEQISRLQEFLDDLKQDKSYKTLYDRLQMADAAFKVFEDQVASGQQVDQTAFVDAGQRLQDLAHEVYGSTAEFFAYQDRLLAATQGAIDNVKSAQNDAANILVIRDAVTDQTAAVVQGQAITNALLGQQVEATQAMLEALYQLTGGGSTLSFNSRSY